MTRVKLLGLDIEVEYDETEVAPYVTEDLEYEESVVTTDGRRIAFDEAANAWVQLGIEA